MTPEYFTPASLSERWGCSTDTVYNLLRTGRLKGFKLGHDWRITDAARTEYETFGGVPETPKRRLPYKAAPVLRVK